MKGYVFLALVALFYVTDAAQFGYPDLEKGEDLKLATSAATPKEDPTPEVTTIRVETTTDDDDDDDDDDFPKWGEMCDNGKLQSPIALSVESSLSGRFHNFDFENYDDDLENAKIVNNGHTIVIHKFTNEMTVKGGHLPGTFIMEQMHFHWSSEHTIEKLRYPLELHIVNRNEKYKNLTEAAKHPDGIAVFAVLFHVSDKENLAIKKILNTADDLRDSTKINVEMKLEETFEVDDLIPKDMNDEYFTYHGSLTTPTCAESVIWTVYENTLPVTLAQISEFEEIEEADGDEIKNNYRFIQKTHRRKVIYVKDDDDDGLDDDDDPEADTDDDDDNPESSTAANQLNLSFTTIILTIFASLIHNYYQ